MSELYTVEVPENKSIDFGDRVETTQIVTTYYDVEWRQVQFYARKHKADHITVQRQSKRLGSAPKLSRVDEVQWSDEAKAGTRRIEEARKSGVAPALTAAAPKLRAGEKIKIDTGYADVVNAMLKTA